MIEEPRPFVLLISGPAGAGKSAAAEAWAIAQPHPTAHIALDDVREFVRAGWVDPRDGWAPEIDRQYRIARANCAEMARRYVAEGISCVIDDAIFPLWESVDYDGWREALGETRRQLIILLPSYEAITERNARRHGTRLLAPDMLRTIYDMMLPWRDQCDVPVIDNSTLSVAETAREIERIVERLRRAHSE